MEIKQSDTQKATSKSLRSEQIALGLMGAGDLPMHLFSESVTWQKGGRALVGSDAVKAACQPVATAKITVDEVVSHGKAAAVSGRFKTDKGAFLFCHMIKFSSASAKQVASIVSFEHPLKGQSA